MTPREGNQPSKEDQVLGRELTEPTVVIVDSLRLRRSCIARVLEQWSSREGLTLASVAPVGLPLECELKANCRLVVLSIGGQSIADADLLQTIESIHSIFPEAPLVIMSDQDEPAEAVAAFRGGAMGFVPASLDPEIALRAFTFILGGGSYFPPSALTSTNFPPHQNKQTDLQNDGGSGGNFPSNIRASEPQWRQLTARQQDVFKLLRNGLPNKIIARHLGMTEATVKVHVRQLMRKFGAENRTQVALCLSSPPTRTWTRPKQKDLIGQASAH